MPWSRVVEMPHRRDGRGRLGGTRLCGGDVTQVGGEGEAGRDKTGWARK